MSQNVLHVDEGLRNQVPDPPEQSGMDLLFRGCNSNAA